MSITRGRMVIVGLMLAGIWAYAAQPSLAQQSKDERSKGKARNSCCKMAMDMDMEDAMESGRNANRSSARDTGNLSITFRSEPSPPRAGENVFEVFVKDRAGRTVDDADVSLTLRMPAMPSMNMPEMQSSAKLAPVGSGIYRGQGVVGMAGRWDVTVSVMRQGRELGTKHVAVLAR